MIGEYLIVGMVVSIFIQFLKNTYGLESTKTKIAVVSASLVLGSLYYMFRDTVYFESFLGILGSASMIWAFFLKGLK
jgi:hypothetical protein